jgi:hypothetical protein
MMMIFPLALVPVILHLIFKVLLMLEDSVWNISVGHRYMHAIHAIHAMGCGRQMCSTFRGHVHVV